MYSNIKLLIYVLTTVEPGMLCDMVILYTSSEHALFVENECQYTVYITSCHPKTRPYFAMTKVLNK